MTLTDANIAYTLLPYSMVNSSDRKYWLFAFRIVGEFSASIAFPVVLFAWIGKQLDTRWGTAPWLKVAGFILAAALSGLVIYRRTKKLAKEYQDL